MRIMKMMRCSECLIVKAMSDVPNADVNHITWCPICKDEQRFEVLQQYVMGN